MDDNSKFFAIFREVGIIHQLTTTLLQRQLPDGVHPSHFAVLSHLIQRGDGKTPVAIANAMQVPKNSMTNTLQVLEARGLIELRPNPDDKRSKLVFMTSEAPAFFGATQERLLDRYGPVLASLGHLNKDALLSELQKLRLHLDDNR